jgi:hypothetical protein
VKPLDLLDQHQYRLAGRRDFSSLIALEPFRPLAQQRELLGIEAAVWHSRIVSLRDAFCSSGEQDHGRPVGLPWSQSAVPYGVMAAE